MVPTLEEFFQKSASRKLLVENIKSNLSVYCRDRLSEEERADLLRLELIMVRQCIEAELEKIKTSKVTMTNTNTPSLAELKRVAEAATQAEWAVQDKNPADKSEPGDPAYPYTYSPEYDVNTTNGEYFDDNGNDDIKICTLFHSGNATHIATFNPQTAGRLIQALELMDEALAKYEQMVWRETMEGPVWAAKEARAKVRKLVKFE